MPLRWYSRKRPDGDDISRSGPMHRPNNPRKSAIFTKHSCDRLRLTARRFSDSLIGMRMTGMVTIPTWFFLVLLVFALWAVLDRLLLPGARWFFRRKVNRVIQEINVRLNIELPQFKLTRRQVLIDRLFHDAKVQEVAAKEAGEKQIPLNVLLARVDRSRGRSSRRSTPIFISASATGWARARRSSSTGSGWGTPIPRPSRP